MFVNVIINIILGLIMSLTLTEEYLSTVVAADSKLDKKELVHWINHYCPQYGIMDNEKRLDAFLAQAAHETNGFRTLKEYGDKKYFTRMYEGRKDLGNLLPGDGAKFPGRGIFQVTGRGNTSDLSKAVGVNFVANPELLEKPQYAVLSACHYWKSRGFNELADKDKFTRMSYMLNGGYNGLADRKSYWKKLLSVILRK